MEADGTSLGAFAVVDASPVVPALERNHVEAKEGVRRVNKGYDREVTSSNPGRCNFSWHINQLFRILLILSTYQS